SRTMEERSAGLNSDIDYQKLEMETSMPLTRISDNNNDNKKEEKNEEGCKTYDTMTEDGIVNYSSQEKKDSPSNIEEQAEKDKYLFMPVKEESGYTVGQQMSFADIPLLAKEARPRHRLIGQVFRTYWLVEYEDTLFFVDQHAAHEKVMYEKLKKNLEEKTIDQQMIAPPIILTFSLKEKERYLMFQDAFAELGFQIEEFGGDEYCIRAVPANLYGIDQQDLFIELLDGLDENSGSLNLDVITDKLASMACKAAVKGNQTLSFREMDSLMDQLMELENPYQCPHGRPTIISMTKYELEKKFKRVQ
ncbi:MAG: DNA mismatch repair protein MutL, partial [Clostridiales bacterium]|nr:DNA mismatch repair protein MutL [Clostridiales bacterium]